MRSAILILIVLAAGTAVADPPPPVRVTIDPTAVAECELVAEVEGTAAGQDRITSSGMLFIHAERLAWRRLKDDADRWGANTVLLTVALSDRGIAAVYRGEAFVCPEVIR